MSPELISISFESRAEASAAGARSADATASGRPCATPPWRSPAASSNRRSWAPHSSGRPVGGAHEVGNVVIPGNLGISVIYRAAPMADVAAPGRRGRARGPRGSWRSSRSWSRGRRVRCVAARSRRAGRPASLGPSPPLPRHRGPVRNTAPTTRHLECRTTFDGALRCAAGCDLLPCGRRSA